MGDLRKSKRDELLPTAVELHRQGKSNTQIAKSLNVSTKSISRWFKNVDFEGSKQTANTNIEPTVHTMMLLTNEVFKGYLLQEAQRLEGLKKWRSAIAIWQILFGVHHMREIDLSSKERQETNTKISAIVQSYIESGDPNAIEIGNNIFDVYFKGIDPNVYYQGKELDVGALNAFYEKSHINDDYIEGFFRNTFGAV